MNKVQKQTGLLFQPDMARSNVAGLKTMTRRVCKNIVEDSAFEGGFKLTSKRCDDALDAFNRAKGLQLPGDPTPCPYGQPGDLIYQKETWATSLAADKIPPKKLEGHGWPIWSSDEVITWHGASSGGPGFVSRGRWRPSLFMPKWAARFWAEIVSIKVERVRDISAEDCLKEGIQARSGGFMVGYTLPEYGPHPVGIVHKTPIAAYKELYEGINGPGSFDRDWCWVIEYRRVER